jgi:hypothetical protein
MRLVELDEESGEFRAESVEEYSSRPAAQVGPGQRGNKEGNRPGPAARVKAGQAIATYLLIGGTASMPVANASNGASLRN